MINGGETWYALVNESLCIYRLAFIIYHSMQCSQCAVAALVFLRSAVAVSAGVSGALFVGGFHPIGQESYAIGWVVGFAIQGGHAGFGFVGEGGLRVVFQHLRVVDFC